MFHWYYVLSNSNSVAWPQGCNKLLLLLLLLLHQTDDKTRI